MSLVYFALWVIFNGRITLEVVIVGAFISLLLDQFMKHVLGIRFAGATFWKCLRLFPDAVVYVIGMIILMVKSGFSASRLVLAPSIDIEPCIVKFTTSLKTSAARVTLAKSFTLSPGTITVSLEGNEFLVHSMNREAAGKLEESIFERLLARMERIVHA